MKRPVIVLPWPFRLPKNAAEGLPTGTKPELPQTSVVLAVALGAGVGVLFGVYPSRRAARLDPITALRAE